MEVENTVPQYDKYPICGEDYVEKQWNACTVRC